MMWLLAMMMMMMMVDIKENFGLRNKTKHQNGMNFNSS